MSHLPDSAFPGLYQAADSASVSAQDSFLLASRVRLGAAITAAVGGALTIRIGHGFDLAAVITVIALVGALVTEIWLLTEQPERLWYDGRALAESVKTLTWRFAMAAAPFTHAMPEAQAREHFLAAVRQLVRDAPPSSLPAVSEAAVNNQLLAVRGLPIHERQAIYLTERIEDQLQWYQDKAAWNRERASRWRRALLGAEVLGILAGIGKVIGVLEVDLAGIVAAVIGASAAWLALKQHDNHARAYAFASNELSIVHGLLQERPDETTWTAEVADAEEAISREHTMWRASRSSPGIGR